MNIFATHVANAAGLHDLIDFANNIVGDLIPLAIALAVMFFFWGLALFIFKSGEDKAHEVGRNRMIWGVIALFVIVAVWGLVRFVGNTLGINEKDNATPPLPQIPAKK